MYEDTENVGVGFFENMFGYLSDRKDVVYLDFTFDVLVVDGVGCVDKEKIMHLEMVLRDKGKWALMLAITDNGQLKPPSGSQHLKSWRYDDRVLLKIQNQLRCSKASGHDVTKML